MFNVAVELDDEFGIGFNGMCVELFEQNSYEAEIDLYKFCSNLVQPLSVLHKILKAGDVTDDLDIATYVDQQDISEDKTNRTADHLGIVTYESTVHPSEEASHESAEAPGHIKDLVNEAENGAQPPGVGGFADVVVEQELIPAQVLPQGREKVRHADGIHFESSFQLFPTHTFTQDNLLN